MAAQFDVAGSIGSCELLPQLIQHLGLQIDRIHFPADAYSTRYGDSEVAGPRADISNVHSRPNR